jgi:ABC-type polysaccharide/polyol phosphate export permease
MSGMALAPTRALMRRALNEVIRVPGAAIPGFLAPMMFMLGITAVFGNLVKLQGYPTDQFLNFIIAISMLQAASFTGAAQGVNLSRDIEQGWFDRLLVAPTPRPVLLGSMVLSAAGRTLLPLTMLLCVGFALGVDWPGVDGLALALLLACSFSLIAASWGIFLALVFKTQAIAPLMQASMFILVLFTPSYAPQAQLKGFMRGFSEVNPVSHVVEGVRQAFVAELSWAETWPALLTVGGLLAVTASLALWAMNRMGE